MSIAMSKTRERFPLSPKKIIKKTITSTLFYVFVLLVIFGSLALSLFAGPAGAINYLGVSALITLALLLFIILVVYLYQRWYFEVYFYDLTDSFIIIKKGVVTPREITIPYERVQDVYVDQDIFDRIFGLYDVHLSSATVSSGMEAHIDGLENLAAMGVREVLLKIVSEKISKRTNIPQQSANNQIPNG